MYWEEYINHRNGKIHSANIEISRGGIGFVGVRVETARCIILGSIKDNREVQMESLGKAC